MIEKWAVKLKLPETSNITFVCDDEKMEGYYRRGALNEKCNLAVEHDTNCYRMWTVNAHSKFFECDNIEYHCLHEIIHMILSHFYLYGWKVMKEYASSDLIIKNFDNLQETAVTDLTNAFLAMDREK